MFRNWLFCLFTLSPCLSLAQTSPAADPETVKAKAPENPFLDATPANTVPANKGWQFGNWMLGLDFGVNGSLTSNNDAQGVPRGMALNFGGKLGVSFNWVSGVHQWRNTLSIIESFSKSPETERIKKPADKFIFDSSYLFAFSEKVWGAFGRFGLDSNLFSSIDVQGNPVTYRVFNDDIGTSTDFPGLDSWTMNPSFSPLELSESLGLWFNLLDQPWLHLELFPGFIFVQSLQSASYIIIDISGDEDTGQEIVSLATLDNYFQMAPSLAFGLKGSLFNDLITYRISANPYYAIWRSSPAPLPGDWTSNINLKSSASLSVKLMKWLRVNYEFSANRLPEQTADFQLTHNVFLTFTNGLF